MHGRGQRVCGQGVQLQTKGVSVEGSCGQGRPGCSDSSDWNSMLLVGWLNIARLYFFPAPACGCCPCCCCCAAVTLLSLWCSACMRICMCSYWS